MPRLKQHIANSKARTGNAFEELHRWMDKPEEILGLDHRRVRHDLSYIDIVKEKFDNVGVKEFLLHIADDYKETAEKWNRICEKCGKLTYNAYDLCIKCYRKKKK